MAQKKNVLFVSLFFLFTLFFLFSVVHAQEAEAPVGVQISNVNEATRAPLNVNENNRENASNFLRHNRKNSTYDIIVGSGSEADDFELIGTTRKPVRIGLVGIPGTGYAWYAVYASADKEAGDNLSTSFIIPDTYDPKDLTAENLTVSQPEPVVNKNANLGRRPLIGGKQTYLSEVVASKPGTYYVSYAYFRAFLPVDQRGDVEYKNFSIRIE